MLIGRTPNRTGAYTWGHPLRLEERTLPEMLREAGYTTGHFGKWHVGSVRRESATHPGAHGFDRWISAPNFYENGATLSDEGRAVTFEGVESSFIAVNPALEWPARFPGHRIIEARAGESANHRRAGAA